uniref:Uncharacterized protein n=2 Tax=Meloidogyne TaxID=189290 RepID=A0A915NL19_9BILA
MNEIEEMKREMRSIRRSLDNCYVENNSLRALVEAQHLKICELVGDVDLTQRGLGIAFLRVRDIERWGERELGFPHPLFPLEQRADELLARIRARRQENQENEEAEENDVPQNERAEEPAVEAASELEN